MIDRIKDLGENGVKRVQLILTIFAVFILAACGGGETTTDLAEHTESTAAIDEKEEIPEEESAEEEEIVEETEAVDEEATTENPSSSEDEVVSSNLGELKVHYIDVGQADASLLQYSDGEKEYTILFDTGDWRGNEVVPYLSSQNVSYIDLVVISHPDADHIGQLEKVMNSFDVGEVWMSGNESSSQTFERAVGAVLASDAGFHEPRAGEEFDIGPMAVDVVYPNSISGKSNEESISVLFTYGTVKLLFTGDAAHSGETYMRSNFNVDADVLHLGHHGSKTSSDPAFIDAVSPSIAIYSAGTGNSYGHPSPEVVTAIQERDIELFGTDVNGTIIITTNGETIDVQAGSGTVTAGTVPEESSETTESETEESEPVAPQGSCININEASVEEIQAIIHIGPARAPDLIALRPFSSVDDLERISGIGPARIDDIKAEGIACVQ